eukprot:1369679-Pleurochrysis_carterae.AAC.1
MNGVCEFNQYCIARPCRPYIQFRHTNSRYGGRGQRGAAPLAGRLHGHVEAPHRRLRACMQSRRSCHYR